MVTAAAGLVDLLPREGVRKVRRLPGGDAAGDDGGRQLLGRSGISAARLASFPSAGAAVDHLIGVAAVGAQLFAVFAVVLVLSILAIAVFQGISVEESSSLLQVALMGGSIVFCVAGAMGILWPKADLVLMWTLLILGLGMGHFPIPGLPAWSIAPMRLIAIPIDGVIATWQELPDDVESSVSRWWVAHAILYPIVWLALAAWKVNRAHRVATTGPGSTRATG